MLTATSAARMTTSPKDLICLNLLIITMLNNNLRKHCNDSDYGEWLKKDGELPKTMR